MSFAVLINVNSKFKSYNFFHSFLCLLGEIKGKSKIPLIGNLKIGMTYIITPQLLNYNFIIIQLMIEFINNTINILLELFLELFLIIA